MCQSLKATTRLLEVALSVGFFLRSRWSPLSLSQAPKLLHSLPHPELLFTVEVKPCNRGGASDQDLYDLPTLCRERLLECL